MKAYEVGEGLKGEAVALFTRKIDGVTFNFVVLLFRGAGGDVAPRDVWNLTHFESGARFVEMKPMNLRPNIAESEKYLRNLVVLAAHAAIDQKVKKHGEKRVRVVIESAPSNSYEVEPGVWLKRNVLSDFSEVA